LSTTEVVCITIEVVVGMNEVVPPLTVVMVVKAVDVENIVVVLFWTYVAEVGAKLVVTVVVVEGIQVDVDVGVGRVKVVVYIVSGSSPSLPGAVGVGCVPGTVTL
jgi:hypothetical protein